MFYRTGLKCYIELKNWIISISNVRNMVEVHCLQVLIIVHHYANSCFDRFISVQQIVNPSREAISILSEKYKRFTFVHPLLALTILVYYLKEELNAKYKLPLFERALKMLKLE